MAYQLSTINLCILMYTYIKRLSVTLSQLLIMIYWADFVSLQTFKVSFYMFSCFSLLNHHSCALNVLYFAIIFDFKSAISFEKYLESRFWTGFLYSHCAQSIVILSIQSIWCTLTEYKKSHKLLIMYQNVIVQLLTLELQTKKDIIECKFE